MINLQTNSWLEFLVDSPVCRATWLVPRSFNVANRIDFIRCFGRTLYCGKKTARRSSQHSDPRVTSCRRSADCDLVHDGNAKQARGLHDERSIPSNAG